MAKIKQTHTKYSEILCDPDLSRPWFSVTAGGRQTGKLAIPGQGGPSSAWQGVKHLGNRVARLEAAI